MSTTPTTAISLDERTNALGLFNTADSYWCAASVLSRANIKSTHPDYPVRFLYYHAIELYLKSFLRAHQYSVDDLAKKLGHNARKLTSEAKALGLFLMDEDRVVLKMMAKTDAVIRSRYIQTGFFTWPSVGALDRTCKSLRATIGEALNKKGFRVRAALTGRR
jgi:hypothetical protein